MVDQLGDLLDFERRKDQPLVVLVKKLRQSWLVEEHQRVDFLFEIGQFGDLFFYYDGETSIGFVVLNLDALLKVFEGVLQVEPDELLVADLDWPGQLRG